MKWTFKNVLTTLGILSIIGMFAILMAMGIEIFTDMDPDVITAQCYALIACWIIFLIWAVYRAWTKSAQNQK